MTLALLHSASAVAVPLHGMSQVAGFSHFIIGGTRVQQGSLAVAHGVSSKAGLTIEKAIDSRVQKFGREDARPACPRPGALPALDQE